MIRVFLLTVFCSFMSFQAGRVNEYMSTTDQRLAFEKQKEAQDRYYKWRLGQVKQWEKELKNGRN